MSPITAKHRVHALRRIDRTPALRTQLELDIGVERGDVTLSSVTPEAMDPEILAAALDSARAAIAPTVPAEWRSELVMEAGLVEQSIVRGSAARPVRHLPYVLASCRGTLLMLAERLSPPWPSPRQRRAAIAPPDHDAPVVLGPSTVLAAVLELLDLSDAHGSAPEMPHPAISISTTAPSPYPPHRAPMLDDGEPAFDPVFLRPETWSRPFAALPRDAVHSVAARFTPAVRPPRRALILESLLPLSAGEGDIEWEAEYTMTDGRGTLLAGPAPLRVRAAACRLLAAATGAVGGPGPALASDVIWGECYGSAPWLQTTLRAGDILA